MGQPFKLHSSRGTWASGGRASSVLCQGPLLDTRRWASARSRASGKSASARRGGRAGEQAGGGGARPWSTLVAGTHAGNFCKAAESLPRLSQTSYTALLPQPCWGGERAPPSMPTSISRMPPLHPFLLLWAHSLALGSFPPQSQLVLEEHPQ